MTILNIIIFAVALACYCATAFFAVQAWFTLRRQQKQIAGIEDVTRGTAQAVIKTHAIVSGLRIQAMFDQMEKLKRELAKLVEQEEFEAARKLQNVIENVHAEAMKAVEALNETYGNGADVKLTTIKPRDAQ